MATGNSVDLDSDHRLNWTVKSSRMGVWNECALAGGSVNGISVDWSDQISTAYMLSQCLPRFARITDNAIILLLYLDEESQIPSRKIVNPRTLLRLSICFFMFFFTRFGREIGFAWRLLPQASWVRGASQW